MKTTIGVLLAAMLMLVAAPGRADTAAACPPAAEQPAPEAVQAAVREARDRGFLWRISKDGHDSYLFGTVHLAKLGWAFPGPTVMQALRATDTLALELDFFDEDIRMRMTNAAAAMRRTELPEALNRRLRRQADAVCVPYDKLAEMAPEMQVVTLTLLAGRWDGLDPTYAIDIVLAGVGHGAHKNVVSLETPESQVRVLQMHDAHETAEFVASGLDDLEAGHARTVLGRLAGDWANADYDDLARYQDWCGCLDTEIERKVMKRTLDARNPELAKKIDELHESGKQVFAAVGSLHMFGPIGLPALLERRGYRVERVRYGAD